MYSGTARFVGRITLVKGIPFYGYHVGYRFYLKIWMLNPVAMTRLGDLLRQGVIMKRIFQPYEAHLQYLLQWMADYNLYGCGYIDCSKATFRGPVPRYEEIVNLTHLWHDRSIPSDLITLETELPRVSNCSIEVDICVQDILNRQDIKPRPLHHDFIERLNPLPPDEKLVHSMAGLWKDETRRRKSQMPNHDLGSSPFPAEVLISMSADPRYSQPGGWIHENEFRDKVMALIQEEKIRSDSRKVSFDTFVKSSPFEKSVRTTLEAVEDLYPGNLRLALDLSPGASIGGVNYDADASDEKEVDAKKILGFSMSEDDDEYAYDTDEDILREFEFSQMKQGDQAEQKHPDANEHDVIDELRLDADAAQNLDHTDSVIPDTSAKPVEARPPETEVLELLTTLDENLDASKSEISSHQDPMNMLRKDVKRQAYPVSPDSMPNKRQRTTAEQGSAGPRSSRLAPEAGALKVSVHGEFSSFTDQSDASKLTQVRKLIPLTVNGSVAPTAHSINKGLSQESLKATEQSQPQILKFPVVKDPQDPTTVLRLSQRSSSQSSSADKKNRVSFEPFLRLSECTGNFSDPFRSVASNSSYPSSVVGSVLTNMRATFGTTLETSTLAYGDPPPTELSVVTTMQDFNLAPMVYQDAFYSNERDVPERAREWAGREFKLQSNTVPFLPEFDTFGDLEDGSRDKAGDTSDKIRVERRYQRQRHDCGLRSWEIADPPPSYSEVAEWSRTGISERSAPTAEYSTQPLASASLRAKTGLSQIDGPTQKNKYGFKYTQNQQSTSVRNEAQYMSIMSLEVHVNTRKSFLPNPEEDEVQCVFWCLQSEEEGLENNANIEGTRLGIVALSEDGSISEKISREFAVEVQEETSELDLIIRLVEIVRSYDPDILTGYEVHASSWGYLMERARLKYEYNLCDEFSRMKAQSHGRFGKDNDKWGFNNTSTIRVTGRHMINIWRAMRSELNLLQYTIENVAFHLLHRRIPHFTWADLTKWYTNAKHRDLAKVLNYFISRVQLNLEILEQHELIPRTSEQARLLGVDFFSVFSRGSQFKVESLMFRIAKPENFLLVSPSRKQVGGQNALECLPLVMEPQSAFYNSPLLVLDFQSLYPSVMIAYNYCYSTFLGRIVNWRGTNKMGFTEYKRQQQLLELLRDHINIAPNGIMYTKPEIRKSLLAKMLGEILETRVMVKSGMKVDRDDKALQRLLNNRQLALKLIANVTYGYTSASFSGRMPCSEIADSIVQTGRETLEKAIALIHSVKRWGAEVVYGDTDSLFVYLKGRTKDQAFDIGEEIAKTVTNMNPRPVKLKFEKVYLPCILLAKKRYVGFKYENRNQTEPEFDAKGIETVRRDGTPAEQKIEETALKIMFRTSDLSQVKAYFQQQCEKIMKGSVSIQDFCFAREVKLGTYSDKGPPPPGALISTKRMLEDARAEPQYGERVPYVVITGAPGARLIDRCVAPEELLENDHRELDAEYYISKNLIPPLERIFNLVGANVRSWYDEMPKVQRVRRVDANLQLRGESKSLATSKKTLESYMRSSSCLVCKEKLESKGPICPRCLGDKPSSLLSLRTRLNAAERRFIDIQKVCQSCSGISPLDEVTCDSKDCPVFYTRTKQKARLKTERSIVEPVIRELSSHIGDMGDLDW